MAFFWLEKKTDTLGNWSFRAFQLTNCELIQYQKQVSDFKDCSDQLIRRRYNIYEIEEVQLGKAVEPYRLNLKFQTFMLSLQFKNKEQPSFVAVYRILCSSQKQILHNKTECRERPIASNICFALYDLLQNLYKHKEILCTPFIFKRELSSTHDIDIETLYRNLIVKGRKYKYEHQDMDIYLLSQTLLYTLRNMPTSLLCDAYCRPLADFVSSILSELNKDKDGDIFVLKLNKKYGLNKIKDELNTRYLLNEKEYKHTNGFSLKNRFGFMTILFSLLSIISSNKYYVKTKASAYDLAVLFATPLQSKQYLLKCTTQYEQTQERYQDNFITMIKIFIYFAHDLFPLLQMNKWKTTTLVCAQSTERQHIHQYNDHFSRGIKNHYFIGTVLRQKSVNYGYFDAKYVVDDDDGDVDDDDGKNDNLMVQPYKVKALLSMRAIPDDYSDLGISIEDEIEFDKEETEEKEEEKEDYKYKQQLMERAHDEIEHSVYHNVDPGDLSVSSWIAQCEICLYSPLMILFDRTRNRNNRNEYE